jgi:hypothetical protein
MERETASNYNYILNNQDFTTRINRESSSADIVKNNKIYEKLASEGCENFFSYIEWIGLANDPNLIILPSNRHFYYDTEDLKDVNAVLNLKQLNYIKQIKEFLHSLHHLLPNKCYFIGSFIDRKNQNVFFSRSADVQNQNAGKIDPIENGIVSRIPFLNMMYNLIDARTDRYMTKRIVILLLEDAGMKVLDMTEFKGYTFFCTQLTKPFSEK